MKKPTNKKIMKPPLDKNPPIQSQKPISNSVPAKNQNMTSDQLIGLIISVTRSELLDMKRTMEDMRNQILQLKSRIVSDELDYKSLGFTLAELGIVELNLLNKTKNFMRSKLSVMGNDGRIKGRLVARRFNLETL